MSQEENKKKRGRKKKEEKEAEIARLWKETEHYQFYQPEPETTEENIKAEIKELDNKEVDQETDEKEEQTTKKRGRKPKGGKLTIMKQPEPIQVATLSNVILHLKCTFNDLEEYNTSSSKMVSDPYSYSPEIPPDIIAYNNDIKNSFFTYIKNNEINNNDTTGQCADKVLGGLCSLCKQNFSNEDDVIATTNKSSEKTAADIDDRNISNKTINSKLKKLKINLYKNQDFDKKSACFWCTYEYDNPTCYIPKYELEDKLYGYGSFCRPECAVAYLMKENIDDSTKFERYHLLNQIYGKVYDYKKSIKPAPNPYYLLEKYYGNLSIQEYRKLLKSDHMLLVLDKPLTRILPELHDDNDDLLMTTSHQLTNSSVSTPTPTPSANSTGKYKVKTAQDKTSGPSKSSIVRDRFCL